jgi:hypothetical protein
VRLAGAALVDWAALGKVVLYSAAAGVGVSLCFALAVAGATRFADMRRDSRSAGAALYGLLAAAGLAATVAAIVLAIVVMTQKS